ncbi:DUF4179 domain-containing protein [Clostridium massiliodielmoense]|uniref:DUF4179 domain-containing protein n=1 Tax=Clostridium massiliodielmoense TaxID=1776385 RepID=UPI000A267F19|nr:DUF4179 domain-containing protein [Clostridium massiliodielmoense]
MNCNFVLNNLHEYIYGELDNDSYIAIKNHLCCCPQCNMEYIKLKKLLTNDIEELTIIKNSIVPPKNLHKKVHKTLKKHSIFTPKYIIAASLLFAFLIIVPSVTAYFKIHKSLAKYKTVSPEIVQRFNTGEGKQINESYTMNDIKFTVDGVIKEKNTISLLYSVKLINNKNTNFALPSKVNVQDQLGFKSEILNEIASLETSFKDKETKGILSFKKPSIFSNKISLRITCFNKGFYKGSTANKIDYREINNAYGNWHIEFEIP